ncbi:unnamed protein product [Coregonus sp. 'balchen']|nr:unnamed protein product [Coregonus sp. 'balchen']
MAANEGDEATVSLVDVLEEDEELENEASAVLAGSDSEKCSYPEGYVKRQALYACSTCTPKGGQPAGDKDQLNTENKYSHNFWGLYCTCNRPYPDPEDPHLGCPVPECVELQEMVCESCMNNAPFLWTYATHLAVPAATKASPCKAEGEVTNEEGDREEGKNTTAEASTSLNNQGEEKVKSNGVPGCKRRHQEMEGGSPSKAPSDCRFKELRGTGTERAEFGAVFWPSAWRTKLCSCVSCKQKSYAEAGMSFLQDESDTVLAYENKGKTTEQEQAGAAEGYNDMKTELKDFLQRFAAEGKVVTPEDIRQFFEQQQNRKRRRANAGQYYCS